MSAWIKLYSYIYMGIMNASKFKGRGTFIVPLMILVESMG